MSRIEDRSIELDGLPGVGELLAGKYRIGETLGIGGMGVVVGGVHVHLEQPVAIKMLLPRVALLPGARDRFVREARAAAKIPGEHAVRILDVDTTPEGVAYMIMERLEGADLGQLAAERGRLDPTEAVDLILQALEGVATAHSAGIVHRDLKPSNLFLARQRDGRAIVKVLDFGISKTISQEGDAAATLTDPNAPIGSPQYMAPEQITDGRTVDGRADLWSVGVMLYELITGQAPFEATTISHLYVKILHEPPAPLSELRTGVPAGLMRAVEACLVKDRRARVQTAGELAALLLPHASPRARAQWSGRDEPDAPSIPPLATSIRSVQATSDADALGETVVASAPTPRRRTVLIAAGITIAAAGLAIVGIAGRGADATTRPLPAESAENKHVAAAGGATSVPAVAVLPNPVVGEPGSTGATGEATSSTAAAPSSMSTAQAVTDLLPRPQATQKPRATSPPGASAAQAPSPTTSARVNTLRDIRPLD